MNQELATQNHGMIDTPETSEDGLQLLMRQAEAMSSAHKLATVLCNTAMVPQTFRGKPDDGAAAILYGAELGLKPQQALQQVFVVHGQPAIYARTMVALLKAKGYRFSTVESTDESVTVNVVAPNGEEETSTWTIDRATKAGYVKNAKYKTDPQAMLYAKAASEVSRKIAPNVLLGIKYTVEDMELEPIKATSERLDTPKRGRGREGVLQALEGKKPKPEQSDEADNFAKAKAAIETAKSEDDLNRIFDHAAKVGLDADQINELSEFAAKRAVEAGIA